MKIFIALFQAFQGLSDVFKKIAQIFIFPSSFGNLAKSNMHKPFFKAAGWGGGMRISSSNRAIFFVLLRG